MAQMCVVQVSCFSHFTQFKTNIRYTTAMFILYYSMCPCVRGPWVRPWTEILGSRFIGSPIGMPNFTLLLYREELFLDDISLAIRGPLLRPCTEILGFRICFFRFMGSPIGMSNFTLLRHPD